MNYHEKKKKKVEFPLLEEELRSMLSILTISIGEMTGRVCALEEEIRRFKESSIRMVHVEKPKYLVRITKPKKKKRKK